MIPHQNHKINSARVTFDDKSIECYMLGIAKPLAYLLRYIKRANTTKEVSLVIAMCEDGARRGFDANGNELYVVKSMIQEMKTKEKIKNLIRRDVAKTYEENKHLNRNAIYRAVSEATGFCESYCVKLVREYEQEKK